MFCTSRESFFFFFFFFFLSFLFMSCHVMFSSRGGGTSSSSFIMLNQLPCYHVCLVKYYSTVGRYILTYSLLYLYRTSAVHTYIYTYIHIYTCMHICKCTGRGSPSCAMPAALMLSCIYIEHSTLLYTSYTRHYALTDLN